MQKKRKAPRGKNKNNKSFFDFEHTEEYLSQIPEVIFLIFMIYVGITIYTDKGKNEIYQKYMKKSLIQGRKYIDYYFPGFLANEKVFNFFDYDTLFIKTANLVLALAVIYIIGSVCLLFFTSTSRKIIIFISLLLDLTFVHNLIYYRNENLFDIIKIIVYLIILLAL